MQKDHALILLKGPSKGLGTMEFLRSMAITYGGKFDLLQWQETTPPHHNVLVVMYSNGLVQINGVARTIINKYLFIGTDEAPIRVLYLLNSQFVNLQFVKHAFGDKLEGIIVDNCTIDQELDVGLPVFLCNRTVVSGSAAAIPLTSDGTARVTDYVLPSKPRPKWANMEDID